MRDIVANTPPPPGIKTYVTGPAPLTSDQHHAGDKSIKLITGITICVIFVMLLFVYRSIVTVLLVLVMMFIELAAARGIVAALGYYDLIGLSTFAVNLLTTLAIAAGTDYAIFLVGRYHEARENGEDRETAFYTMYHGTAHVILGSGLTIAGATFCLHFTRLPYFSTLGIPLAIGMLVAVAAALTMAPAMLTICSRFGLFDPKRAMKTRGWRRIGAAVVRWPGPILAASVALALVGLLALPSYKPSYNDRNYLPKDIPANQGYAAADRHFPQARMNPEMLLVETDHDLRNSADMLVIDRIAKGIFHIPGIGRVQSITRPQGTPIEHTSIPFLISMQGTSQQMNQDYMDKVMGNMLTQANDMQTSINTMERMQSITVQMAATTHGMVEKMHDMTVDIQQLRDHIADFDDFFRPLRNIFYWEPHCFDIPICWSFRSIFDTLDGIDTMTDDIQSLMPLMDRLDSLMPQMVALMPSMIETMKSMQHITLTMYQSQKSQQDQMKAMQENQGAMGQAFDASKNDDSFYLPPEVFDNADFKRGMKMFVSPDGKAVRFIISHEGDPATAEGIKLIPQIKNAAFEAIKGTPLEGSRIYMAGTASTYKDMQEGSNWDLLIAGIASLCLIFIIMLCAHSSGDRLGGHRRDGVVVPRHVVRLIRADLAAHPGHPAALDDHCDVGDHPAGGGIRLQPVIGIQVQRGDTRWNKDRHHQVDGRHRRGGDVCRLGVRVHHDVDGGQRPRRRRSGGLDDRSRLVVRYIGDPVVHDAIDRGNDGTVVLVAPESANPAEAGAMADAAAAPGRNSGQRRGWRPSL